MDTALADNTYVPIPPISLHSEKHSLALQWAITPANSSHLANIFALGHSVYSAGLKDYFQTVYQADQWQINALQGKLAAIEETQATIIDQRLRSSKDHATAQISQYKERLETLQQQMDSRITEERAFAKREASTELSRAQRDLEACHIELQRWTEAARGAETQALKNEIAILKSSNFVKGRQGEFLIKDHLQENFCDWLIDYTGSNPHECDLLMSSVEGERIMIESKNKDAITKGDIDKFYGDIAYAATNQSKTKSNTKTISSNGAVFISIRTQNIPWKGHMYLERVGETLVMFLGFSDNQELQMRLHGYMRLFITTMRVLTAITAANASEKAAVDVDVDIVVPSESDEIIAGIVLKVQTFYASLASDSKAISALKTNTIIMQKSATESMTLIGDLEIRHMQRCSEWKEWLAFHGKPAPGDISICTPEENGRSNNKVLHSCTTCTTTFTNKKVLAKHATECKKNKI
jgi:hypothetical protein